MDAILRASINDYTHLHDALGRYTVYSISYSDFGENRTCLRRFSEFYSFGQSLANPGTSYSTDALSLINNNSNRNRICKFLFGPGTNTSDSRVSTIPLPPKKVFFRFDDAFLENRKKMLDAYLKNIIQQVFDGDLYLHIKTLCHFLKLPADALPYMLFVASRNQFINHVNYSISQLLLYLEENGKADYRAAHLSVVNRLINIIETFEGEIVSKAFLCILFILNRSDESLERKYANKFFNISLRFKIDYSLTESLDLSSISGFLASQTAICILNKNHMRNPHPKDIGNNFFLIVLWQELDYREYFSNDEDLFRFYQQTTDKNIPEATLAVGISAAYLLSHNWFSDHCMQKAEEYVSSAYDLLQSETLSPNMFAFIFNLFSGVSLNNLNIILNGSHRVLALSLILKRIEIDDLYKIVDNHLTDESIVSDEIIKGSGRCKEFERVIIKGEIPEVLKVMYIPLKGIEAFRWNSKFKVLLSNILYSIYPFNSWTNQVTPRDQLYSLSVTIAAKILLLLPWPIRYDDTLTEKSSSNVDVVENGFYLNLSALESNYGNTSKVKSIEFFDDKVGTIANTSENMPNSWYTTLMAKRSDLKEEADFKKLFPSIQISFPLLHSRLGIYTVVYESMLNEIDSFFQYFDNFDLSLTNYKNEKSQGYLDDIVIGNTYVTSLFTLFEENIKLKTQSNNTLLTPGTSFLHSLIQYKMIIDTLEVAADKLLMVFNAGRDMLNRFVEVSEACKLLLDSLIQDVPRVLSDQLSDLLHRKEQTKEKGFISKSLLAKTLKTLLDNGNELTRIKNMLEVTKTQIDYIHGFLGKSSPSSDSKLNSFRESRAALEADYENLENTAKEIEDKIAKAEIDVEKLRIDSSSYNDKLKQLDEEIVGLHSSQCDLRLLGFIRSIAVEVRLRECLEMISKINNVKIRIDRSMNSLKQIVENEEKQRSFLNNLLQTFIKSLKGFYYSINNDLNDYDE